MAKLGFVGLGVMGGGVAGRLLAAGHEVHGWNRTREKAAALVDQGLVLGDSPRAVAEETDVVFTMVTNVPALRAVAEGEEGILSGLGPGKVWVDMTTAAPAVSRELADRVRETGADMLDAPVSGSVSTLEEGRLAIMVGGNEETFHRVEPILRDIGPLVTRVGDNGQALLLKIAINLSLFVQMTAFSEGLLLAEKAGIEKEAVAVGVCSALRQDDVITSTHRGHGHCIAKGADVKRMYCELLGKEEGYCRGKGGSMHIADHVNGNLGANAIVGGSTGIATGAAFSAKRRGTDEVAVCFFGEGALGQGVLYAVMNMASLWQLPVIYVCENNLYNEYTHYSETTAGEIVARAAAFGILAEEVDG